MRHGVSVCIYCGEGVYNGNCCIECFEERDKEIAIGAMLDDLASEVEVMQALETLESDKGKEAPDDQR